MDKEPASKKMKFESAEDVLEQYLDYGGVPRPETWDGGYDKFELKPSCYGDDGFVDDFRNKSSGWASNVFKLFIGEVGFTINTSHVGSVYKVRIHR